MTPHCDDVGDQYQEKGLYEGGERVEQEGHRTQGPLRGLKTFLGNFDRPNLTFEVWRKPSDFDKAIDCVLQPLVAMQRQHHGGAAIVYCFSQKECEMVAMELSGRGLSACAYHAGMSDDMRGNCQDAWTSGNLSVICATIAFGLGINMPTVRVVVHFTLSKSLELYYQEVSRGGGREGEHV